MASSGERLDVKALRTLLQHWPAQRGRGRLIAGWRRFVARESDLAFDIGDGALVHLELDDYMVQWAFVGDHRRDRSYQRSLDLIEPSSVVIDVGANIGLWSLAAAARASAGAVHSFEPIPSTFERLQRNLRLNRTANVVANRLAVDREAGPATLYEAVESNSGGAGYLRRPGALTPVVVDRTTLDEYCARRGIDRVDLIKLDIEGAEWLALQGAEEMLTSATPPAIFMELDGNLTQQLGWEPSEVLEWLRERGYRAMSAAPDGHLVDLDATPAGSRDVLAFHDSATG